MVIRRSSAAEIQALIADLDGTAELRRDSAVARLSIIGERAVERLVKALPVLSTNGRLAALQALEAIGDHRSLEAALAGLDDSDTALAAAAAAVVRSCLRADAGTAVLDRLAEAATDPAHPDRARLLVLDALDELPPRAVAPLRKALERDPSPALRAWAAGSTRATRGDARPAAVPDLDEALAGHLPAKADRLRLLVAEHGRDTPLPNLHRLIELVREREATSSREADRVAWATARAVIHQALAERGSNVALYDLRDTIERADGPLAVEFLAALGAIGDESCLEPIVMAYARSAGASTGARPDWWHTHLAETFREIVRRERLTGRHSVIRRIRTRWPGAAAELLEPRRRRGTAASPVLPALPES